MQQAMRYVYKDKDGNVVGHVSRLEEVVSGDSKPRKQTIPYFKANGQAGIPQDFPAHLRLFGMETVKHSSEPVFVVEGEKCAFALQTLGLQAVTSLGGCGQGHLANWGQLEGAEVIYLLPDQDEAGNKFMYGIYSRIKKLNPALRVKIIRLPNLPDKGDVCDHLSTLPELTGWNELDSLEGHPSREVILQKLLKTVDACIEDIPAEWGYVITKSRLKAIDAGSFNRLNLPKRSALLAPWLLEASINMVFADRGLGKTFFCLSSAVAIADGGEFLAYQADAPSPVLYLDGEMQAPLMQDRLKMLTNGQETAVPLHIYTPDIQDLDESPDLSTRHGQAMVDELIEKIGAKVIFIDNISTFMRTGSENEAESWASVQPWLIKHRKYGRAIVLVHHANKEGKQRGTHKKEDVMDTVIQLKRPEDYVTGEDATRLVVGFTKSRHLYGKNTQELEATLKQEGEKLVWECKAAEGRFHEVIRLLKEGQLNQTEIADTVGVAKGTVSKWKQRGLNKGLL
jgi:KaiC/GvpD/RAD55 family RecA-like ATPase/DNA-binding transcriptional regulator YiaG